MIESWNRLSSLCLIKASRRCASSSSVVDIQVSTLDLKFVLPVRVHSPSTCTDKVPILMIQGWTGIRTDWGAIPRILSSKTNRSVITYDARYLGDSKLAQTKQNRSDKRSGKGDTNELSLEIMALDSLAVIQAYHRELCSREKHVAFSVCGVSLGGLVAQVLYELTHEQSTTLNPEYDIHMNNYEISSMVLISSFPIKRQTKKRDRVDELQLKLSQHHFLNSLEDWDETCLTSQRRASENFFQHLGEKFLGRPGRIQMKERLIKSFVNSRERFHLNHKKGVDLQRRILLDQHYFLHENKDDHEQNDSIRIHIPTIVIHGEDDSVIPVKYGKELYNACTHEKQYVVIPECDHLSWITHTQDVITAVDSFLLNMK